MDQISGKKISEEQGAQVVQNKDGRKTGGKKMGGVLRAALFLLLVVLWIAALSYTALSAIGTVYLLKGRLLWGAEERARQTVLEGINNTDPTHLTHEEYRRYISKRFMYLYFEFGYPVAKEYCEELGVKYALYSVYGNRLGGTLPRSEEEQADVYVFSLGAFPEYPEVKDYKLKLLLPEGTFDFQMADQDLPLYELYAFWEEHPKETILGLIYGLSLSVLLFLLMIFLLLRREREKISLLCRLPVELVVGPAVCGFFCLRPWTGMAMPSSVSELKDWIVRGEGMLLIALFLICHLILRLREEEWYRRSILIKLSLGAGKLLQVYAELWRNWKLIWKVGVIVAAVTAAELFLLWGLLPLNQASSWAAIAVCAAEKLLAAPYLLYHALVLTRLSQAAHEVASGNLNYQMRPPAMPGLLREFGQDMNAVADSISIAVEDRTRSEKLKTELITNVSHDIKTPLTSIINFSDLIAKEHPENPKIAEYADHLYKQSTRLKKLIEDLMEASKASTGNLETNLELCDVRVLLEQCLGEYEQRLKEHGLDLIVRQCTESIWIMADTRMLWRIFDNLINNICKYAQTSTRVYLNTERWGDKVRINFKNVSSYALDVSPEDLMERFVRGDLSRHTEGNGLGLSIVRSLMDLQGAEITLAVDGDLFKAILVFAVVEKAPEQEEGKEEENEKNS